MGTDRNSSTPKKDNRKGTAVAFNLVYFRVKEMGEVQTVINMSQRIRVRHLTQFFTQYFDVGQQQAKHQAREYWNDERDCSDIDFQRIHGVYDI